MLSNPLLKYLTTVNLLLLLLVSSCNIINPDEDQPAYVKIEPFTFDPLPASQEMGLSASTKIKDAWVYIDGDFHGVYELPAQFPILETGNRKLSILPGILLNGIAGTRSPYPFYKGSEYSGDFTPGSLTTITPKTEYFELAECTYCESFEGSGFSLTNTANSDTIMYQLPAGNPNVFEGAGSGAAYLTTENSLFEVASTTSFLPPGAAAPVYLELDYKINQEMTVGLFVLRPGLEQLQIPVVTLRPTTGWNKVYIQLGYTVSSYPTASGFKLFFGAIKDPATTQSEFYLDNIKVVNF